MHNNKTIKGVVKDNLCTGCGTCVSLCSHSAIELVKDDSKGIYLPRISEERCDQCGICFDVCPGHSMNFKDLNLAIFGREPEDILLGNYLNCHVGFASDYQVRYDSSSGGLVTALLIFALEEGIIDGALVTKMNKEKPLEPQPFIARTRDEIISAAKSKYCPVPANIALREILKAKGKYAVVGLPCHLHGIRKAEIADERLRERIVLHLGIFCAKTISFLGTELLLKRIGVRKEEVEKLDYRGEGYPGSMIIKLNNGQRKLIPQDEYYDIKFGSFVPWRCTLCSDYAAELADISFGDWPDMEKEDRVGSSIAISRNRQGEDILQRMIYKRKIEVSAISRDKVKESKEGISGKKRRLKARLTILKLLARTEPFYDIPLPQPPVRAYLGSSLLYLEIFLASKRSLWWLLDIYCSLLKFGSYIRSRLKL